MKTPDDLHEMYAKLTAKRPELAVSHVAIVKPKAAGQEPWVRGMERDGGVRRLDNEEMSALIRVKWEDELPSGHFLHRDNTKFCVFVGHPDWTVNPVGIWHYSAIEALYYFHMGRAG